MTITFFSNFLNIHQLPFCLELIKHIGEENFRFVATTRIDQDRIAMGFEDMNVTKSFVVRAYEGGSSYKEAIRLAVESDVAIMGSAPIKFTEGRMRSNKLTFQYTERLLKLGWKVFTRPGFYRSIYRRYFRYRYMNQYVLCASAYTAPDLEKLGWPRNKCFKWGYFPEVNIAEPHGVEKNGLKRPGVSILWAGRLIGLKHPEVAVQLAELLKKAEKPFTMRIIGDGEKMDSLKQKIKDKNLDDCITMLGSQPHEVVLEEMHKSDIYIFTSDRNEGWGAVLNEAMSAGCTVVASDAIGSAPFLIKNGVNGYTYHDGDTEDLLQKVCGLIDDPQKRNQLSAEAIKTMCDEWSIENATNNLIELIIGIQKNCKTPIVSGPCSLA